MRTDAGHDVLALGVVRNSNDQFGGKHLVFFFASGFSLSMRSTRPHASIESSLPLLGNEERSQAKYDYVDKKDR